MVLSNEHGRAFELICAKEIESSAKALGIVFMYTQRAVKDNQRDQAHVNNLPIFLKTDFEKAAKALIKWISKKGWFSSTASIELDRLSDFSGVNGTTTDITLKISKANGQVSFEEISLKHNHDALKHPRLFRLPEQCGIRDRSLKAAHSQTIKLIFQDFYAKAKKLKPSAISFKEIKSIDNAFIDKNIYEPLIKMIIRFLNKHANNKDNAAEFFKFLRGSDNFYGIKNEESNIIIKNFVGIPLPKSFKITYPYLNKLNTFLIEFDNGWQITFRLHTATTNFVNSQGKLKYDSTKFDVQPENLNSVIKIESEPKA